jgi:hypothetical protein
MAVCGFPPSPKSARERADASPNKQQASRTRPNKPYKPKQASSHHAALEHAVGSRHDVFRPRRADESYHGLRYVYELKAAGVGSTRRVARTRASQGRYAAASVDWEDGNALLSSVCVMDAHTILSRCSLPRDCHSHARRIQIARRRLLRLQRPSRWGSPRAAPRHHRGHGIARRRPGGSTTAQ